MKYEVKNRFTGETQFIADIDCADDTSESIKLGLAVRWGLENNANLRDANLYDADLYGANLRDADLGGTNLYGANLRGADLSNANLRGADLRGADLSDANLSGANLRNTRLFRANLYGTNLRGADLSNANLRGADLRGADLRDANLRDADLYGANLRDADLGGANLIGADLGGCPVRLENIHKVVYGAASKEGALDMGAWHCGTSHCRAGWVVALAGEGGRALEWSHGTAVAASIIYMNSDPSLDKIPDFYTDNETALADMKRLAEGG